MGRKTMGRRTLKHGAGSAWIEGKSWRLADEVRYLQRRAAAHDARFITVGRLALFSTETGDAWVLDRADRLAARVAREGDPEAIFIEETEANFTIGWKGRYQIDGAVFVYTDPESGRVLSIWGYPTAHIAQLR
jgi:hypothetical protein